MRSFIKSHRKNDSNTSNTPSEAVLLDSIGANSNITSSVISHTRPASNTNSFNSASDDYQPPSSYSNRSSTTPIPSPKMQQHPQFTPPQTGQSSISSPKKLLTPIKNLFTSASHSKSSLTTPTSGESLNAAVSSPKNKFRKHVRSRSHISMSNDLSKLPEEKPKNSLFDNTTYQKLTPFEHKVKSSKSSTSLNLFSESQAKPVRRSSITLSNGHKTTKKEKPLHLRSRHITSLPLSNKLGSELGPPIALSPSPSFNTSIPSIADSEGGFHTKQVEFDPITRTQFRDNRETDRKQEHSTNFVHEEDDEDEYDSSSSQFSFVQDMKGGRNTSVKYYKTRDLQKEAVTDMGILNTFNELDLGYDVDEFSDYDYENNGVDIDDDDEGEFGGYEEEDETQFNKFYDEDINENQPVMDIQSDANDTDQLQTETKEEDQTLNVLDLPLFANRTPQSRNPFDRSFHMSIRGPKLGTPKDSPAKSNFEEDILENYLDISELPSVTNSNENLTGLNDPSVNNNYELLGLNSPIINGLTIGNNLLHRAGRHRNFANTNRLIIHRKPIEFYEESNNNSGFTVNENEGFTKYVHSFHGSFDDGINKTIHEKVTGFEEFWAKQAVQKSDNIMVGLGIGDSGTSGTSGTGNYEQPGLGMRTSNSTSNSFTSKLTVSDVGSTTTSGSSIQAKSLLVMRANNPIRQSVSDMMAVLGSLEMPNMKTSEDSVPKEDLKTRDSVVNMIGVLENMEDKFKDDSKSTEKSTNELRISIIGMMDVLANLEQVEEPNTDSKTVNVKEETKNLRNSVIGMMDLLANIEQQSEEKPYKQESRKSVADMLSTLSILQNSHEEVHKAKTIEEPKRKASFKRYSWFNSQENLSVPTKDKPSSIKEYDPTDDNDKYNSSLDQDLLDEVNQIPDDFDFDEAQNQLSLQPLLQFSSRSQSRERTGFYRSNSYNRKPKKTVVSNQLLSNKIETMNKTVTFYNNSTLSPASSFVSRSRSLSRGPSTRSMNSFASVNEEEEEEENARNGFDDINGDIDDDLLNEINDEQSYNSYKSNDLGTINESFNSRTPSYRRDFDRYR